MASDAACLEVRLKRRGPRVIVFHGHNVRRGTHSLALRRVLTQTSLRSGGALLCLQGMYSEVELQVINRHWKRTPARVLGRTVLNHL